LDIDGVLTFTITSAAKGVKIAMTYRVSSDPGLNLDHIAPAWTPSFRNKSRGWDDMPILEGRNNGLIHRPLIWPKPNFASIQSPKRLMEYGGDQK
jgi:hypothetical protein